MSTVTIDNLGMKTHERYAQDQEVLESKYITESFSIAPHSESVGTSSIYSPQWEALFDLHLCNTPWALFSAPPKYHVQRNKFFASRIVPGVNWEEGEETFPLLDKILDAPKAENQSNLSFEKDKTAILNLFESVKRLNILLAEINAKKMGGLKG
jgi:hypothetical protein